MTDFEHRRTSVEELARAVRALADVAAETAVDPDVVRDAAATVRDLTERLAAATDDDPYSGLVRRPVDYSRPQNPMPLNPIIGDCSPCRPEVAMRYDDGVVRGTARLSKRFTGPPGFAHGGISAMLADQIVALTPGAAGLRGGITKSLEVRYRHALPLHEELTVWGACTADGDDMAARFTITAREVVAVEGTAVVVPYSRLAARVAQTRAEPVTE
ncbi:MAG: PaaI family thioesterase [Actinomycetota bacterium]